MKEDLLLKHFIETMKSRLVPGENLATRLMESLCIGREAVYRRLRGEVPFTFEEIAVISRTLRISLDELAGEKDPVFVPFYLSRTRIVDEECPKEEVTNLAALFDKAKARRDPNSEAGIALNTLPVLLMMDYPRLLKFRVFKWLYQRDGGNEAKPYDEVVIPRSLYRHGMERLLSLTEISSVSLILDKMLFAHVINDIRSFSLIGLLSAGDVQEIKGDLSGLLDELERITTTGENRMG
ncbi:MAG: hypothetical protein LBF09_02995, partial [Odoribacteraceae bacterium]|nr:hypothetical protein [Odoribacteraceae bacterium]